LKGVGISILISEAGILLFFAVILVIVANIKLRKRLV
jgi:ABC-2 type transport system permease protein